MSGTLYVLGLGLEPIDHATLEVLQAIGRSSVVFEQGLGDETVAFLERFCPDRRPYADAKAVLAELEAGRTVAFATRAHPFLFSNAAAELVAACESRDIPWQSFGSVSSMGLAMALTGRTLGEDIFGVQSFDCAAVAEGTVSVNPGLPAALHFYGALSREAFAAALGRLAASYPPEHPVTWCVAAGIRKVTALKDTAALHAELTPGTVLYMEAAGKNRSRWGTAFEPHYRSQEVSGQDYKKAPAWVKE